MQEVIRLQLSDVTRARGGTVSLQDARRVDAAVLEAGKGPPAGPGGRFWGRRVNTFAGFPYWERCPPAWNVPASLRMC